MQMECQVDVKSKKPKNSGRKWIVVELVVTSISLYRRTTIRSIADALSINKSTLDNGLKMWAKTALQITRALFEGNVDDRNWQQTRPTGLTGHPRRSDRSVVL